MNKKTKKYNRFFGIKFEKTAFRKIKKIAEQKHLSITSLLRQWVMERLDKELQVDKND